MFSNNNLTPYIVGKCYFKLTYFDYEFIYPRIDTIVYLGNALELKDKFPTKDGYLYFQDAESYVNHGFLNSHGHKLDEGEVVVMQTNEVEAKKTIFDINGLIHELNS